MMLEGGLGWGSMENILNNGILKTAFSKKQLVNHNFLIMENFSKLPSCFKINQPYTFFSGVGILWESSSWSKDGFRL